MQNDDLTLLREYSARQSEAAFASLVSRHVNLVYSVALRQVSDPHLAEEITQAVFIILARKAGALGYKTILSGWLCRTARYASANAMKIQRRRRQREQEAHMQNVVNESGSAAGTGGSKLEEAWPHIAPLLDDAMGKLGQKDHDALVLRFFENKNFAAVGAALGATEDAAKMRVSRALEKLRRFFNKRGISLSAAGLAGAVSVNAVQSAPAGFAAVVASGALSGTVAATAAIIATKIITMTTLQKIAVAAALTVTVGAGLYEAHQNVQLRTENQTLRQTTQPEASPLAAQIQQLRRERDDATNRLAAMTAELAKNKTNNLELLRLRGLASAARQATAEAERLRAQLARQAAAPADTNLLTSAMADATQQAMEQQTAGKLARMTASLQLTPGQALAVSNILARQAHLMAASMSQAFTGKFDKDEISRLATASGNPEMQIQSLLTPAQKASYPAYQQQENAHTASQSANSELTQLQTMLNLSTEQSDSVYAALYNLSFDQLNGNAAPPAGTADMMRWMLDQKAAALEPLLTPPQLEAYRKQLATQAKLAKDIMAKMQNAGIGK